jgi:hypothetical protein
MAVANAKFFSSTIAMGRNTFTKEAENLFAKTQSVVTLSKPKPIKRRFRRKRKRKVLRETFLSRLDEYDRDLDDAEFDSLVKDMERSPYTTEVYEAIVEVDAPRQVWEPWFILPLTVSYLWDPSYVLSLCPLEEPEDELTEEEKELLLESNDASQAVESSIDESADDELTEMDLWILAGASCGADDWVELSDFVEDERTQLSDRDASDSVEAGRFELTRHQHLVAREIDSDTPETGDDRGKDPTYDDTKGITKSIEQPMATKTSRGFLWFKKASPKDARDESRTHRERRRVEEELAPPSETIVPRHEDTAKAEYDMNIGESATAETPPAFGGQLLREDVRTGREGYNASPPSEFRYVRED